MKRNHTMSTVGIIGNMLRSFGSIFNSKQDRVAKVVNPPKLRAPGRRTFDYVGIDNAAHSVRIGNAFPVRPQHQSRFFIATRENRLLLSI